MAGAVLAFCGQLMRQKAAAGPLALVPFPIELGLNLGNRSVALGPGQGPGPAVSY